MEWDGRYKYTGWKPLYWEDPDSDSIVPVIPPDGYYVSGVEYKEGKLHSVTYDQIRSRWYRIKKYFGLMKRWSDGIQILHYRRRKEEVLSSGIIRGLGAPVLDQC